ncbi:MAG: DUF4388 domain-containing protein [Planctomycetota bacterium]
MQRLSPTSRPLDRPAADIARVCRLLETRAASLRRLLEAHRFRCQIQDQLEKATGHLQAAAEALELVTSYAPPASEDSRATLRGSVGNLLKGMGVSQGETRPKDHGDGLSGNSYTVPVPDILSFLSTYRRTGVLWVDTLEEAFQIELRDGEVTYASSDNPPSGSRIGEILVKLGILGTGQLYECLQRYSSPGEMFGATLLREGVLTRAELERALVHQTQEIFRRLFAASIATYHFAPGLQLAATDDLRRNVTHLLLDSAKLADEEKR